MPDFWSPLSFSQRAAAISTLVLTVGAIIEYWEKLKHLAILFLKWILWRSNPFERCTLRKLALHSLGPIMVVVGIGGELIFETSEFIDANRLQAIEDRKVAAVSTNASAALRLAANNEREAARELAKAKESLSPWVLDAAAEGRITEKLKTFPNSPFELAEDSYPYAMDLAVKLARVLYGVWKPVDPGTVIPPGIQSTAPELLALPNPFGISIWKVSFVGVTVEIPPKGTPTPRIRLGTVIPVDFGPPARALASALLAEGIPVTVVLLKSERDAIVPMMGGSVHLIVGRKP